LLLAGRMARVGRLRDDPPRRARELRHRPDALAGLRLRHDDRPHRHAALRHPEHPPHVRRRRPFARAAGMRVALGWLREWVDLPDEEELCERLTLAGLEIEEILREGPDLSAIVVGHVLERRQHPNADRLSLCRAAEPSRYRSCAARPTWRPARRWRWPCRESLCPTAPSSRSRRSAVRARKG